MILSKDEITMRYRDARSKMEIIRILADMNCCSKKDMREYLRSECGFDVYEPAGQSKEVLEKARTAKVTKDDSVKTETVDAIKKVGEIEENEAVEVEKSQPVPVDVPALIDCGYISKDSIKMIAFDAMSDFMMSQSVSSEFMQGFLMGVNTILNAKEVRK